MENIRLIGWKSICQHVGLSRKTLAAFGDFPAYRLKKGGAVFAWTDEIDAWMRSRASRLVADSRETPPFAAK